MHTHKNITSPYLRSLFATELRRQRRVVRFMRATGRAATADFVCGMQYGIESAFETAQAERDREIATMDSVEWME